MNKMKKLIADCLNDKLIMSTFISNLFYSLAYPTCQYIMISGINQKMISMRGLVVCITGTILPIMWNNYSEKLYKFYGILLKLEAIFYAILVISYSVFGISMRTYYIIDAIVTCVISMNIVHGNNKLKVLRYNGDVRERYDNNITLFTNASSLIGIVISLIITIPGNIAFILLAIGICFDNLFFYFAWKETLHK